MKKRLFSILLLILIGLSCNDLNNLFDDINSYNIVFKGLTHQYLASSNMTKDTVGGVDAAGLGSPSYSNGVLNGFLDGASPKTISVPSSVVNIAGDYTISIWIKVVSVGTENNPVITLLADSPVQSGDLKHAVNHVLRIESNDVFNSIRFQNGTNIGSGFYEATTFATSYNYMDGIWHQATAVVSGNYMSLYVDGKLMKSENRGAVLYSTSQRLYFGVNRNGLNNPLGYFGGSIGRTNIWARALSAAEAADLYSLEKVLYP